MQLLQFILVTFYQQLPTNTIKLIPINAVMLNILLTVPLQAAPFQFSPLQDMPNKKWVINISRQLKIVWVAPGICDW